MRDEPVVAAINNQDVRYRPTNIIGDEARGSATLRASWMSAIEGAADWAQLVTWNDHSEHSAFVPTTGTQFGYYDLTAYYVSWFKSGRPPVIKRDVLYYFHRVMNGPPWISQFRSAGGGWVNEIELVALLTAPATLEIETEAGTTRRAVGAGMQVLTAPLPKQGKPVFRLVRADRPLIEIQSPFAVDPSPRASDLVYRSGSSLRAQYGRLHPPAVICSSSNADACLEAPGEPVWLAQ